MDRTEGSFSGAGGVEIAWQAWTEEPARGVVVIAHDVCGHGGRYGNVVDWIVPKGCAVVAPDHRGHGRSGGERALIDDVDAAAADLGTVIGQAHADHPGVPVFLLGQGMGGALGIALALRRPLDGLILTAPMLTPPRPSPVDATALSRDPAVVSAFEADPLVHHGPLPEQTVAALSEEIATFDSRAKELTLPFLLMHGYADRLADPEKSRAFHAAAGSDAKILVLWAGLFHEIFNEPPEDREEPLERLSGWLDEHAP
ncbi:MAG: lysophospholipase [Solirubrobacteraceae bacterium]